MNGRDLETAEKITPLVGQTTDERRTEAILRRAATWETETPEPVGLAYRALTKQGVLRGGGRRHFAIRHWWSMGTLGVASALTALVYVHPISFDEPLTDTAPPEPTPITQKASLKPVSVKATNHSAPPAPDAATKEKEATTNHAQPESSATISAGTERPRSVARRNIGRRTPATTYRPPHRTYLAHHAASSRRHEEAHPAAPQPKSAETTGGAQLAANPTPSDATPVPENYHVLVPVMLTHESEDGSELIATPAMMEVAYEPTVQK